MGGAERLRTTTFAGWVGDTDTNDYYRFTLNSTSNLQVNITDMSLDADVTVYSANGTTILGSSCNDGNVAEAITLSSLAAGTYYVLVNAFNGNNTNYNLALAATSAVMPDLAGGATTTARDLGVVDNTNQTVRDWVGGVDPNDYYRFTLSTANNLRLNLTGLGADANVMVYSSNGTTVLSTGANTGVTSEAVTLNNLAAGTYYARVYPGVITANTSYSLNLLAQVPDAALNTIATARDIGALSATAQTFTDWVGSTDLSDYYRFTLSSSSHVRANLTGLAADANVVIYASNGTTVLGTGANTGVTSEALTISNLAAGTYYARVYPGVTTANTNYNLAVSATPADSSGNTTATARSIGTIGTAVQTFTDWVGSADNSDYYQFAISGLRTVSLNLTGLSADANIMVYAADGTSIMGRGLTTSTSSELLTITNLYSGTYYARIYPGTATANTNYSLAMTALNQTVVVDSAANTPAGARDIGNVTTAPLVFNDSVAYYNDPDFYRFTLTGTTDVRLSLPGTGLSLSATIYAADGTTQLASSNINNNNGLTLNDRAAGTYFCEIVNRSYGNTIPYSLSISGRPVVPGTAGDGNSIATSRDVGALSGYGSPYIDSIGATDSNDYYRFTSDIRTITVALTGLSADADLVIYAADGITELGNSFNSGTNSESITFTNPTAGSIFYARVYTAANAATTSYSLSLTTTDIPGGTSGYNTISGGTGNDSLTGTSNNHNTLLGGAGNDTLVGNVYADILVGDAGNDTLTGGGGGSNDFFRFLASVNEGVDTITDFVSGTDYIQVYSPNFANISAGTLTADRFVTAGTALTSTNAVFIYNTTTGALAFDRDGSDGGAATQFATLTGHPTLTAGDIYVIAA